MNSSVESALAGLRALLGPLGCLEAPADLAPYLVEWRGLYHGAALAVLRPQRTEDLAEAVRICAGAGLPIVPQGGNTGLCGGAVGQAAGVILSLGRMTRIRGVDPQTYVLTAEAGVTLAAVQEAARAVDRLFPLSLASQGSAQLGGVLSTNAGGTQVLRYGMARDLVLGLEVVLADGRIWHGLRQLRKDNSGYDLKQMFLGAEGTLGIITAAAVKLFAAPRDVATGFCALRDPAAGIELLARLRAASGEAVSACEYMNRTTLDFVLRHAPGCRDPLSGPHPHYVLIELTSPRAEGDLNGVLEQTLAQAISDGLVGDAVTARSAAQGRALWRLREEASDAQKPEGASIKHDVSVPLGRVPAFLTRATLACEAAMPGLRVAAFGHVGDGNIHFNLSQPIGADRAAFLGQWSRFNRIVHDIVAELEGSFSAEHGIGRLKLDEMAHYKTPLDLELMGRLKQAFDPAWLLNPGAVVRR